MLKNNLTLACTTAILASSLFAQAPTPAPELKKLAPLLGTWEAEGTANVMPGMPAMAWTSTSHVRWVLDGHALCDDMIIEFTGMPMGALVIRTYMTYDANTEKFTTFAVQNTGEIKHGELHWLDDNTTVQVTTGMREGVPYCERWVTSTADGKSEYKSTVAMGAEEARVEIQGTAKRTSEDAKGLDLTAYDAFTMGPAEVPEAMSKLARMAGSYSMKGTSRMADGEGMEAVGNTHATSLFGGLVMQVNDEGTSFPYSSHHFLGWNPDSDSFNHFGVNNMGMAAWSPGRMVGSAMVFSNVALMDGKPTISRTIMTVNDAGKLDSISAHAMSGTEAPFEQFVGSFEPSAVDASAGKDKK